jgi:hypothetical protein
MKAAPQPVPGALPAAVPEWRRGLAGRLARRLAMAGGLLVAALATATCGGGGGGSGPTGPPPPSSSIVFTAAAGGSLQLASGAGTQGTTLVLELRSTGVQDLYGVAFHLSYPTAVLRFSGAAEGTLLNAGGTVPTSFQFVDSPAGNLVVGLTRLGRVAGTAAAGTLLTLQFTGVATGSGNLAFSANRAIDSTGNTILVAWAGGTVQVTIVP